MSNQSLRVSPNTISLGINSTSPHPTLCIHSKVPRKKTGTPSWRYFKFLRFLECDVGSASLARCVDCFYNLRNGDLTRDYGLCVRENSFVERLERTEFLSLKDSERTVLSVLDLCLCDGELHALNNLSGSNHWLVTFYCISPRNNSFLPLNRENRHKSLI